jgi:hypothetical protein
MTTKPKSNPFLAIKASHDVTAESEPLTDVAQNNTDTQANVQTATSAQVHKKTSAPAESKRNPRGIRIRDDIFKKYRLLAVEEEVPLYELIEAALEEHLHTRKGRNKAT